ncbi:hypothetical protein KFK09_002127 [Dendrobium nobile]|uniref:Uncharacterized protein n=1 Tax=Dendrobium nobile TaxID=94219 RepID=A0A8T3CCX1_DENNO|nr:hypothetical protein KFK09_002127 [Dendrobium nobile]
MADLKSSIPKTNNPSSNSTGSFSPFIKSGPAIGTPIKSAPAAASNSKPDPFGSLMGFTSKPSSNVPLSTVESSGSGGGGVGALVLRECPDGSKASTDQWWQ